MAKPQPAPVPPSKPESSSWLAFGLIGVCGLLVGATGMYFLLLPKLVQPTLPGTTMGAAPATDPTSHLPTPELTAGQSPAQADRTLGNFYYDHQNWPEAIRYYQSAIKQGSDDSDIRTDLGNAYRFASRPDDALTQYQLAQKMNPAHEFSLFNQGGLFLEDLKQPEKAAEVWTEYLRRFPQGRNVAAAQQLLAHAGAPQMGTTAALPDSHPAVTSAGPSTAEVERLLKLVPPASTPAKP